jgi:hypothetical protein
MQTENWDCASRVLSRTGTFRPTSSPVDLYRWMPLDTEKLPLHNSSLGGAHDAATRPMCLGPKPS